MPKSQSVLKIRPAIVDNYLSRHLTKGTGGPARCRLPQQPLIVNNYQLCDPTQARFMSVAFLQIDRHII